MNERQQAAFEHWMNQGAGRTYAETANEFEVSRQSVQQWANKYDWMGLLKNNRSQHEQNKRKSIRGAASVEELFDIIKKDGFPDFSEKYLETVSVLTLKFMEDLKSGAVPGIRNIREFRDVIEICERLEARMKDGQSILDAFDKIPETLKGGLVDFAEKKKKKGIGK